MSRHSPEYHVDRAVRNGSTSVGMLMMAGITLLQALHNKNLVIVAETCMPFELGAAGIYGSFAVRNARAALEQPVPGMHEARLIAEPTPDTQTLAKMIGLGG